MLEVMFSLISSLFGCFFLFYFFVVMYWMDLGITPKRNKARKPARKNEMWICVLCTVFLKTHCPGWMPIQYVLLAEWCFEFSYSIHSCTLIQAIALSENCANLVAKVSWVVVKPLVSVLQSLYPRNDLALAQGPFPCWVCVSLSSQQGVIWE